MTVYICMWSDVYSNFYSAEYNSVEDALQWFAKLLADGFYNATIYKTIKTIKQEDNENVG